MDPSAPDRLISLPEAADVTGRSVGGLIGLALRRPDRLPVYAPAEDAGSSGALAVDGRQPQARSANTPKHRDPTSPDPVHLLPHELRRLLTERGTPIEALLVPRIALAGLHLDGEPRPAGARSAPPPPPAEIATPEPETAPPGPPAADALLDYGAAAAFLGMPRGTLYNLVWEKRVPHIRLSARTVRFDRATLERWLDRRRVDAKQ